MNNHKSPPKLSSNGSSKNIHNYLMVDEARHERNGSGKIAIYPTELITKSSEFPTDLTDDPVNIEETFPVDDRPFEVSEKPAAKKFSVFKIMLWALPLLVMDFYGIGANDLAMTLSDDRQRYRGFSHWRRSGRFGNSPEYRMAFAGR